MLIHNSDSRVSIQTPTTEQVQQITNVVDETDRLGASRMTLAEVLSRVDAIAESRGDAEIAHGAEDELHQDVLRAIAEGTCDDPASCASAALQTLDIKFARWCV